MFAHTTQTRLLLRLTDGCIYLPAALVIAMPPLLRTAPTKEMRDPSTFQLVAPHDQPPGVVRSHRRAGLERSPRRMVVLFSPATERPRP